MKTIWVAARAALLYDAERIHQRAASAAAETYWTCNPLSRGAGDCERAIPFPAISQASEAWAILDKDAAIHLTRHTAEIIQVF
jgi:hypothetical protein